MPQRTIPNVEKKPDRWHADEEVQQRADDIILGREQPGLEDNDKNVPTLTPSFEVGEGEYIRYEDDVEDGAGRCPYNAGSVCLNPTTCLCRQVYKGVPSQDRQSSDVSFHPHDTPNDAIMNDSHWKFDTILKHLAL